MKIAIDISQIVYKGTGVARFTQGLVKSILQYDKNHSWLFFFSSLRRQLDFDLEKKIKEKGHQLVKWKIPPMLLSLLWNNLHQFSLLINRWRLPIVNFDWFISSDWTEPSLPSSIKKATIVHDLVFLRYPETVEKKILTVQKKRLSWIKKESKIIFADSCATKNDLINLLKIPEDRIIVNYPGVEIAIPTKEQIEKTRQKFNLQKSFILTVGKTEPRKNLKRLIQAFQQLNNPNIDLVIAGPKGWENFNKGMIKQSINHFSQVNKNKYHNIKFLGYVPDNELYSLYSSCLFFIFPSIWEGFGYPIIEAMKLGVPIATSNTSSLKEIAQEAALFFNPFNINEITQSIHQLLDDKILRENLIKKGKKRSQTFDWKNYYNHLIKTLTNN